MLPPPPLVRSSTARWRRSGMASSSRSAPAAPPSHPTPLPTRRRSPYRSTQPTPHRRCHPATTRIRLNSTTPQARPTPLLPPTSTSRPRALSPTHSHTRCFSPCLLRATGGVWTRSTAAWRRRMWTSWARGARWRGGSGSPTGRGTVGARSGPSSRKRTSAPRSTAATGGWSRTGRASRRSTSSTCRRAPRRECTKHRRTLA